jgi:hypothetical protein
MKLIIGALRKYGLKNALDSLSSDAESLNIDDNWTLGEIMLVIDDKMEEIQKMNKHLAAKYKDKIIPEERKNLRQWILPIMFEKEDDADIFEKDLESIDAKEFDIPLKDNKPLILMNKTKLNAFAIKVLMKYKLIVREGHSVKPEESKKG